MQYDVRRVAMFVGGLMWLVLPASAADAQTQPHRFEIAAGTMYGFQDPERPMTAGRIISSGSTLGGSRSWWRVRGTGKVTLWSTRRTSTRCSGRGFRVATGC